MKIFALVAASSFFMLPFATAQAADSKATALLKKEGCVNCHTVSTKKVGPSFKSVAKKYKGNADGEKKVIEQITTSEKHPHVKTTNEADIKALAHHILTR